MTAGDDLLLSSFTPPVKCHRYDFLSHLIKAFSLVILLVTSLAILPFPTEARPAASSDQELAAGIADFQNGKFEQAALNFSAASRSYEEQVNPTGQIRALTYLGEALYHVGQYNQAILSLDFALRLCERLEGCEEKAMILGRKGNVFFVMGQLDQAQQHLESALAIARRIETQSLTASLLNDLGNVLATESRNAEAIAAYTESIIVSDATKDQALAITALTNSARAWIQEGDPTEAEALLLLALSRTRELKDSHHKSASFVNIGMAFHEFQQSQFPNKKSLLKKAANSLEEGIEVGERIGDLKMVSYAWGQLGHLYEAEGHLDDALQLTRRAILTAQQINVPEALYQWEWQTGRILNALHRPREAIAAYQGAMTTLQPIRLEFSFNPQQSQLSFRQKVGPLFFQLADLLLKQADATPSEPHSDDWLFQARDTIEAFKVAELQDYFRDDCVQTALSHMEDIDKVSQSTTAILYPIILPDRLELLVSVAGQLKRQTVPVNQKTLTQEVRIFRRLLEKRTTNQYKPHAQQLYDWLIRPIAPWLEEKGIVTLVIVPDGALRTVPIGALHDGQHFLIQQYALATTPGLTLTDPKPINHDSLKLLSVGLTESVQGFPPLPNVADELNSLDNLFKGKRLLNDQFVVSSLEREMQDEEFTILHIASHGRFSSNSKDTFVLAFDERLSMDQLDKLIGLYQFRESPLDLLTLSACETAAGDDRAALGLAGVAIKAGARSALATLWFINDKVSSGLVTEFYTQLKNPSLSKAAALQQAQIKVIQDPAYQHPGYWSPFLLLNNWL